jgi:hypothetical protein
MMTTPESAVTNTMPLAVLIGKILVLTMAPYAMAPQRRLSDELEGTRRNRHGRVRW